MKKSLLLVIPTLLALTACNFFQKKDSEKPADKPGDQTSQGGGGQQSTQPSQPKNASEIYLESALNYTGGYEITESMFGLGVDDYTKISPETKGYNYCTVTYTKAEESGVAQDTGSPTYNLKGYSFASGDLWYWEVDVHGNGKYGNGPECINKTALEVAAADPVEGDTRECKFYADVRGEGTYYFASRSTQVVGNATWYRRYEYIFNEHGDVVEGDSYEGHMIGESSFNDSRHSFTVAFEMKAD